MGLWPLTGAWISQHPCSQRRATLSLSAQEKGWGLATGAEVTQRQLCHQSPRQLPRLQPQAHRTDCRQLSRRDCPCQTTQHGLNLSRGADLVSLLCTACLREMLSFYCLLWQGAAQWIWSVSRTSGALLTGLPSCLRNFLQDGMVQSQRKLLTQYQVIPEVGISQLSSLSAGSSILSTHSLPSFFSLR